MIEDYKLLCEEIGVVGKFEAYRSYTQKYPYFFQGVFKYLYSSPYPHFLDTVDLFSFLIFLPILEFHI